MDVRDLPTNIYTSPLLGYRQTHFPDLSTHSIHSHAHICRMLRHNYTVVLIQIEHNCFLRDKGKQYQRNGKRRLVSDGYACFGWLRYSSSSPKYDTYTNEKSLSHCRDQGSS